MPLFLKIVVGIILAYLLFEIVEHMIIPAVWLIMKGKRKDVTGPLGLIGEIGEVKEWRGKEGKIFVHGSIWTATSDAPLAPGDKAKVIGVEGLELRIETISA